MASSVAKPSGEQTIAEHDIVRLRTAIAIGEDTVPAGAIGTVVHIYRGDDAFEVEFDAPFHVVTVLSGLVDRVPV